MGKAPIGVAEIAKKYEKKVLAFLAGVSQKDATLCNNMASTHFSSYIAHGNNAERSDGL